MAEYEHTHNGSSYRLVKTPMNWIDAQVSAVAWPIVLVILHTLYPGCNIFDYVADQKQPNTSRAIMDCGKLTLFLL